MQALLRLLSEPPMPPDDSDFSLKIEFQKGVGDPRRIFDAASALIDAFEILDDALVGSIDSKIETVMVLEDVQASSLKIWLKTLLECVDDDALKDLEWKKQIGKYLVKAKYLVLEFLDDKSALQPSLEDLRGGLKRLAQETDVRRFPDYPSVQDAKLVTALDRIQEGKRELGPQDKLFVETEDKVYEVDLTSTWEPTAVIPLEDARETHSFGELILTIRKPDFIRDTLWQFSHGKNTISAPILDQEWLGQFRDRQVPLLPGDALRCRVKFTYLYDEQGELIGQRIDIEKVLEVIRGPGEQRGLFH